MPELNKIVSAILRDITEARSIADAYSKDIAIQYGSDALLKFFPVPRADIKEMSFDLKFAVGSLQEDPNKRQAKDIKIKALPEKFGSQFLDEAASTLKTLSAQNPIYKDAFSKINESNVTSVLKTEMIRELREYIAATPDKRVTDETLKNHVNKIFYNNVPYPFRFHEFDVFEWSPGKKEFGIQLVAKDGKQIISSAQRFNSIIDAFETIQLLVENPDKHVVEKSENGKGTFTIVDSAGRERLKNAKIDLFISEIELRKLKLTKEDSLAKVVATKFKSGQQTFDSVVNSDFPVDNPLHEALNKIADKIKDKIIEQQLTIENEPGEIKVDVIMTPEQLQKIPESAISTFRFTAEIRNHTLTQDGDEQNLIPQ